MTAVTIADLNRAKVDLDRWAEFLHSAAATVTLCNGQVVPTRAALVAEFPKRACSCGVRLISGTLTLSRDVQFLPATPHSIVLMKRDGSIQSIACTAGPDANQVVLATAPAEAIVTAETNDGGIRTAFSFAADSARAAQAWLVQELRMSDDGYVQVRAINYSADYYAADGLAVPAKAGVIN